MKELIKKYWYGLILVVCLILIYFVVYNFDNSEISEPVIYEEIGLEKEKKEEVQSVEVSTYYVDIKGEVVKPGVYEVNKDSRIIDVISKAGGLTKNADTSLINLSKKVKDEMNIKIYSKKEISLAKENINKEPEVIEIIKEIEKECVCPEINNTCDKNNDALIDSEVNVSNDNTTNEEETLKEENNKNDSKLININTASKEELMSIPNIGESKANSIIEYRNKNKFSKIDDILNVSGIGESVFEKIKDYITV